jgi:alkanesulfonate monooxygenase SsuD/methylene tetrahydromethanopterin reductase-like flavin-dependent oxidoreductase (luciferase family)
MTVAKNGLIVAAETEAQALAEAGRVHEALGDESTLEEFCAREIVGTPDECLRRLADLEQRGVNYLLTRFVDDAHMERVARLIVPRL